MVKKKKSKLEMGCVVLTLSFLILIISSFVTFNVFTARYAPQSFINKAKLGMTVSEVKNSFPEELLLADIHPIKDTKYSYAKVCAEQRNLNPTYLVVYHNLYWPITTATACYLYFDENKIYIGHYMSSS